MTFSYALKKPNILVATYEIVTPMFIGDVEQEATAISALAFKGGLRFWWRALVWSEIRNSILNNNDALKELHRREAELFGSSANNDKKKIYGKGRVQISVLHNPLKITNKGVVHQEFASHTAARYLGYGVMEAFPRQSGAIKAGQLIRSCINENQTFQVELSSSEEFDKTLISALKLMGLLGGLGSKARKGLGSISLVSLSLLNGNESQLWQSPKTSAEYMNAVQELLSHICIDKQAPFSAFTNNTKIWQLVETQKNSYVVLNNYAKQLVKYRSWGNNGKVFGQDAERNFKDDHDWFKGNENLISTTFHPQRVMFGLPHSYFTMEEQSKRNALVEWRGSKDENGRRASPLFFHVHKLSGENKQYIGIAFLLKADFLDGAKQKVLLNQFTEKDKRKRFIVENKTVPLKEDWSVIENFINGQETNTGNVRFPQKKQIFPINQ